MNQNLIHDALNDLDDTMIDAVDELRRRPTIMMRSLLRLGALAAVVCIIFLSRTVFTPGKQTEDSSHAVHYGSLADKLLGETENETMNGFFQIRVKILELRDDGFVAETAYKTESSNTATNSVLTAVYTDAIPTEIISQLAVGDVVEVCYVPDGAFGTKVFVYSIKPIT